MGKTESGQGSATAQVVLGKVSGIFGVKGWLKIFSETQPREQILTYSPWTLSKSAEAPQFEVIDGRLQGKLVVARLRGIDTREQAAKLVDMAISINRDCLPATAEDEYYWADLEGLRVITTGGCELGVVDYLFATGANDVLVVKGDREILLPWLLEEVVKRVDLQAGVIEVDWDPDF